MAICSAFMHVSNVLCNSYGAVMMLKPLLCYYVLSACHTMLYCATVLTCVTRELFSDVCIQLFFLHAICTFSHLPISLNVVVVRTYVLEAIAFSLCHVNLYVRTYRLTWHKLNAIASRTRYTNYKEKN